NSSTPIAYYNVDMFAEAGVEPPAKGTSWSFSEMLEACDAIQASGVTQNCMALGQVGWYFEQILANSGGLYYDNNNGRTGRAQTATFNQGAGVEVFEFLTGLVANGYSPNLGNTWTDTDSVFLSGEAAIMFDSTSGAGGLQDGADFEVGTMFMPYADSAGDRNGVIIGGAALWLLDSEDDAKDAAAWDFMKFMAAEDQQVTWHTETGYFPVRTDISNNADLQSFWAENPNFVTAIDQLATTKTKLADGSPNYAVLGGRAGPAPAIRRFVVEAYSAVLDDGMSPQEALDVAVEKANQELSDYNAFFASEDDANTGSTTTAMADTDTSGIEPVTLEFWHAMGGDLGEVVDELVTRFNDSQDVITVNATFQGSYDDTYNALLAAFETGTEPNIIQNFDLASQTMIDTGRLVPAYQLMEADGFDSSIFIPAVADYYSDDNGMVAMAFNSSTPIAYYNVDMLKEAGVEPPAEGTSWSFSEMLAACDAIQASGVTQNCVALGQTGWYFEQILANSGGLYYNNDNGRTGRASEVMFNQGTGVEVFEFLTGLVANGYSANLGNTWTDTDSVFFAGDAAIMFDSTSGAGGLQDGADFEVGTMFIPYADSAGDRNGVIIGGAALWLLDSGDETTNAAVWEFMKFMAGEDQQVTWHT
ncbi:MAG TPA: extracellular solute-binding protein, partial [Anaerolineae bacterium]|nr:extracellular solute-binding protein [Anaerolineae bacterium]